MLEKGASKQPWINRKQSGLLGPFFLSHDLLIRCLLCKTAENNLGDVEAY